ncbi:hypothetical protein E4U42_007786 [Claviceps africana]|uniref:Shugoshin n=1 Tax=Claviceps africana TaxID=83212 RepID=A0A8K0J0K8_9HYPO|nr:hypothetical protein E4U42_007786 [Claviceps africana]
MLRQNRDLAKSNNVRALRIRELESECSLMLSENLELRSRILELETQVENNEASRIADHALAIKARLEAQLAEWASLLSGLGSEPPIKRQSPRIRNSMKQRMSFCPDRPSPSQRRLRDIARDIEELGSISENRSSSRQSLNPEQIRALRFEADSAALESPSKQRIIEQQPMAVDSSPQPDLTTSEISSPPRRRIEPPVSFSSPKATKVTSIPVPSPEKKKMEPVGHQPKAMTQSSMPSLEHVPTKAGTKRKFSQDDNDHVPPRHSVNENAPPRIVTDKVSIRERALGKTLRELTGIRKVAREGSEDVPARPSATENDKVFIREKALGKASREPTGIRKVARDKQASAGNGRKALTAKSTNDNISSPKKNAKLAVMNEASACQEDLVKTKPPKERIKSKLKDDMDPGVQAISDLEARSSTTAAMSNEPVIPVSEPVLMSSSSPEPTSREDEPRGDTPPPADISPDGEVSRPSRRNRTTVSYAEPNLRVKMRRPTKELFDAVTGEGKYARRVSQCDQSSSEEPKMKRESCAGDLVTRLPAAADPAETNSPGPSRIPAISLETKSTVQDVSSAAVNRRPKRHSRPVDYAADMSTDADDDDDGGDVDVYEFTSSSPHVDKDDSAEKATGGRRQGAATRRRSAAVDSDKGTTAKDRTSSRRRSMMV